MTNEEFIILAEKVAEGNASISEIALYNASYESFQQDPQSLKADGLDSKALKKESLARFWKNRDDAKRAVKLWPGFRVRSGRTGLVAAAAVAVMVFGVWFFNYRGEIRRDAPDDKNAIVNDVAPGKNGATITLGNGEVIQLSDEKRGVVIGDVVKYSDGSDVRYSSGSRSSGPASPGQRSTGPVGVRSLIPSDLQGAEGKGGEGLQGAKGLQGGDGGTRSLIASTAKGQTYQFTLPDGTKVWLNADSRISFPAQFSGKERRILLSGEGYFEVAKDKAHPFIVRTDAVSGKADAVKGRAGENGSKGIAGQEVEVLGTHFNITSYADEASTKTTLLEGLVRINTLPRIGVSGAGIVIRPGEQAVLNAASKLSVKTVDAQEAVAWKTGKFSFESEEIGNIMKQVSRWYDVEVSYTADVQKIRISGSVSRFANISVLLQKLEQTGLVHFKVEGRKVYAGK